MLRRAFARLTFAKPLTHVQPEGNITLVNLPTYYQVRWPAAGYQPGEVATVTLLGRTVQIRPRATTYTYDFGDGHHAGPAPPTLAGRTRAARSGTPTSTTATPTCTSEPPTRVSTACPAAPGRTST